MNVSNKARLLRCIVCLPCVVGVVVPPMLMGWAGIVLSLALFVIGALLAEHLFNLVARRTRWLNDPTSNDHAGSGA